MANRPARRLLVAALIGGAALVLAACSNSSNPPAATTTTTAASTSTTGHASTTTTSAASNTTTTSGTLVPQTADVTEFYSPSKNISCEIDASQAGTGGAGNGAMCLTITPARRAVLGTDGSVTVCNGQNCLSNAGVDTPTLQYGQSITLGPFTCVSSQAGMTCTNGSGAGYRIASQGVTALGGATLTTTAS